MLLCCVAVTASPLSTTCTPGVGEAPAGPRSTDSPGPAMGLQHCQQVLPSVAFASSEVRRKSGEHPQSASGEHWVASIAHLFLHAFGASMSLLQHSKHSLPSSQVAFLRLRPSGQVHWSE